MDSTLRKDGFRTEFRETKRNWKSVFFHTTGKAARLLDYVNKLALFAAEERLWTYLRSTSLRSKADLALWY
jgi:hypothetical protein